jgi:predicted alpha/beta superfamily hydrolase
MSETDHGIVGVSGGGLFVGYALLTRPSAFRRYICGSPGFYAGNGAIFDLEEQYAAEHDDLAADVFMAAGEAELVEPWISAVGCASSMARMAERLAMRAYPSLRLTARIFSGESHGTMWAPTLSHGIRAVWAAD